MNLTEIWHHDGFVYNLSHQINSESKHVPLFQFRTFTRTMIPENNKATFYSHVHNASHQITREKPQKSIPPIRGSRIYSYPSSSSTPLLGNQTAVKLIIIFPHKNQQSRMESETHPDIRWQFWIILFYCSTRKS